VGGLICNDLWANPGWTPVPDPHLSQQLAGMGARIVFHAVYAGGSSDGWSGVARAYHETNLRLRARAGGLWIVTANTREPTDLPNAAPSGVVDPDGNWAIEAAPRGEAFFAYTIAVDSEGAGTN
jgi:predicted amidohydrolase